MTRIVKPGVIPVPVTPWQITTLFTCPNCACQWYADNGDWHKIEPSYALHGSAALNDAGCAGMDCPTCGKLCQIREPGKPIMRGL